MSKSALEERVSRLERQLAELKDAFEKRQSAKDWRSAVGMFSDNDEVMKRIDAAGQAIREQERRQAKRRGASQRHKK